MRQLEVSIPAALAVGAASAADKQGVSVSTWVATAIEQRLKLDAGRALLAEWAAEDATRQAAARASGRAS